MSQTRKRGIGRRLLRWTVWLGLMLFLSSIVAVLFYRFVPPYWTATMLMDDNGITRDWEPIERIDRDMVRAVIAAEDGKFCQHEGFDWEAIEEARRRNAEGGRIRGGSTISQQTAKNVFLWQGGGYPRKVAEAYFTFLIEKIWGKRRIMEVYLNVAETGIGTYGVTEGAKRYFGKDASSLSRREAAAIAAVLPLPKERPGRNPTGFTARYGSTIAARIGVVERDGLDACVYEKGEAPVNQDTPEQPQPDPTPTPRPAQPVEPQPAEPGVEPPIEEPATDPVDPAPVETPPAEPPTEMPPPEA
ncbi:monofunctional biosynthetic peptidoglycan transglycosylase [Sphingomicrobium sp. B8]|uniref:Biosynthetic peptidoglycan transglycosylase n=1 Tax=Sphingomicrobium clamense TaxID=2851013 RepID=A0ABS6V6L5_9SPHN|nr:monofunctional biosynthetic peptidoglycan transglycosylase [Sphingomicrobium sp. B8]